MITVNELIKSYGTQRVLHGISHAQQKGEAIVIIGPSGCGKSTFLRCLNQLETIDSGQITIAGITFDAADGHRLTSGDREKQRQLRLRAGMVFQSFNLFPHLTVLENVIIGPIQVNDEPRDAARQRARDLLKKVGLQDRADFHPCQLSGGQQQRVAIARALVNAPPLVQRARSGIARRSAPRHARPCRRRHDHDGRHP